MDRYQQYEGGEEREWLVDMAAWKKTHRTGARVRQLLSDSKKKMKLMMIGRVGGGNKTTPPSELDLGSGREGGIRALLEQVSHTRGHEDGTSTITSVYTYNNYTARSAGASTGKEMAQKYGWESTPKAFDTAAKALPVVNNTSTSSSTSGAVREWQAATTTIFPESWRKTQQLGTTPLVASVTFPSDIEKGNDLESISPQCDCHCGSSTSNNRSNIISNSIDSTNKSKCTELQSQQLDHVTRMHCAQKKSDTADIFKDLMQQQEKLSKEISNEIIHTRHALVAEQELVAQRQEQQAMQNVVCSRKQEEQNAKLDSILTAVNMINQNSRTTNNPMSAASNHHAAAAHVDFREEEFIYLAALVKQQKRDILSWMDEAFATRIPVKKAHGDEQNGDSHDVDDDDIASLKAENGLLKVKNKSLQEMLVHLQWQQDKLLTENATLHETMVAHDSNRDAARQRTILSREKQASIPSHEQREKEKEGSLHGVKILVRKYKGNNNTRSSVMRKTQLLQSGADVYHAASAADDTITLTSTITSSSRSDGNNDQEEHEQGRDKHEGELQHQHQQHKRQQPGSRNKSSRANDLKETF